MENNYKNYSDTAILAGIKDNDRNAFKAIYHDRTKPLRTYIHNNSGDTDDAYDIEQKAIIILYEKVVAGGFELTAKLSTYLYAVGRNLWYKELKSRSQYVTESTYGHIEIGQEEAVELRLEPKDDEETKMLAALNQLGEICQKLLRGKFYDNKSDKELSAKLGDLTEENVRKRRYKCLQKVKKILNKEK